MDYTEAAQAVYDEILDDLEEVIGDEHGSELLPRYLDQAVGIVVSHRFPFDGRGLEHLERCYYGRVIEVASYLFAKRGAEGEDRHVENGTTHEWGSASVPASMLADIMPTAGIPQ